MHSSGTETIVLALLPKGEISLKIASAEATAAASTQKKAVCSKARRERGMAARTTNGQLSAQSRLAQRYIFVRFRSLII